MPCQAREGTTRKLRPAWLWPVALLAVALVASGCERPRPTGAGTTLPTAATAEASGAISADGSSTVGPLMQLAAEGFGRTNPQIGIAVGVAGTGGGLQRLCAGEIDIANASRPIKDEEAADCERAGIAYSEIVIANDGLSIVVNPRNTWVSCLTVRQLTRIWGADSRVGRWRALERDYPDVSLRLYGPGTDSGTFDFFTGTINGEEGSSRTDYSASEDDNVIVQGVAGDRGALGYLGLSYAEENAERVKLLAVDGGDGCVTPSAETVQDGTYTPLSRPLYVYVKHSAARRPEMRAFLGYVVRHAGAIARAARFVPLTRAQTATARRELAEAVAP
jgi:phosphate transport system substrate-binding protein